jgi:HAD superfamily hydrolase (TIGR01484 family)
MKPLSALSGTACANLKVVLTDIDDTLTTDGRLTADAYSALEMLRASKLIVVPVTGRPAGWCDLIARFWPVDGVIGENGAFYFRYDHDSRVMRRYYAASEGERRSNQQRLSALAIQILGEVQGSALATDQAYRVADLAIDFREDVPALSLEKVNHIVRIFQQAGATARISSIHVNGWFGDYDKLTTTRELLASEFRIELTSDRDEVLFVGDSPNDEPMFRAIALSVGVANVLECRENLRHLPSYLTQQRSGAGFVELANYLVAARQRSG